MTMIDPDDLAARLKELDSDFKKAPDKSSGGFVRFKPPEGNYWATVDEIDFFEAKATGAAYLKIVFVIQHDDHKDKYAGKTIEKVYVLEPEKALRASFTVQSAADEDQEDNQYVVLRYDSPVVRADTVASYDTKAEAWDFVAKILHDEGVQKLGYLRQDLSVLGIDVEDISMADIRPGSPIWDSILDRNVELAVKFGRKQDADGDPYRNVYINTSQPPLGKAKSDIPTPAEDYKPTDTDESVPF